MIMESNFKYLTFIFGGAIVGEFFYGSVANAMWENANKGVSVGFRG